MFRAWPLKVRGSIVEKFVLLVRVLAQFWGGRGAFGAWLAGTGCGASPTMPRVTLLLFSQANIPKNKKKYQVLRTIAGLAVNVHTI